MRLAVVETYERVIELEVPDDASKYQAMDAIKAAALKAPGISDKDWVMATVRTEAETPGDVELEVGCRKYGPEWFDY